MDDFKERHEDGEFLEDEMFYKKGHFGEQLKKTSLKGKGKRLTPKQPPVDEKDKKLGNSYKALKIKLVKSIGSELKRPPTVWPVFNIIPDRNPLLSIPLVRSTKL